ncbi:Uncharacterised protein [Yersinia ruckeri]|nr:Uncharacterised protein [Yersinia ruckeri]
MRHRRPTERLCRRNALSSKQGTRRITQRCKRGMVNGNTAFSHHIFLVAQAEGVSQVPTNTLRDDIDGIMLAFKGFSESETWLGNTVKKQHVT